MTQTKDNKYDKWARRLGLILKDYDDELSDGLMLRLVVALQMAEEEGKKFQAAIDEMVAAHEGTK